MIRDSETALVVLYYACCTMPWAMLSRGERKADKVVEQGTEKKEKVRYDRVLSR